jgi:hypothetical protein
MIEEKEPFTESLRLLLCELSELKETRRADSGLTTLSFQSVAAPERHVWLDTDLCGCLSIDLEDWATNLTWDNAVATVVVARDPNCVDVVRAWLSGSALDDCLRFPGIIDVKLASGGSR